MKATLSKIGMLIAGGIGCAVLSTMLLLAQSPCQHGGPCYKQLCGDDTGFLGSRADGAFHIAYWHYSKPAPTGPPMANAISPNVWYHPSDNPSGGGIPAVKTGQKFLRYRVVLPEWLPCYVTPDQIKEWDHMLYRAPGGAHPQELDGVWVSGPDERAHRRCAKL